MGSYKVEFTRRAEKELRKIDSRYIPRIIEAIESLGSHPRPVGCTKLEGSEDTYRIRVGNYRVIYEIEDGNLVILVIRVRHRRSAYD